MIKIAIFASGSGTNAENIAKYFLENNKIAISLIISNKKNAGVIARSKHLDIPVIIISKTDLQSPKALINSLSDLNIDYIILAGFLALIPKELIQAYPNKIINIHPALLPKYGGKGMYGDKVHEAVINNKENESGISIHYVNEKYDEGGIIVQAHCPVYANDTPDSLAHRIHKLEYRYLPQSIEQIIVDHSE
jgi:phosphoribosylglycinamide formyltransferase-1